MGWAGYLSRNPCGQVKPASEYDEKYVLATIMRTRKLLGIDNSSIQNAALSIQTDNHMTEHKSIPNEKTHSAFRTKQQAEFKATLKSIYYLDSLENEVIP